MQPVPPTILFLYFISAGEVYGQINVTTQERILLKAGSTTLPLQVDSATDVMLSGGAESIPEFPGGRTAWKDFLKRNVNAAIPLINKAPSGIYTVLIKATIGSDSIVRNVHAESNAGYGMDGEIMRVVKMSPKWKPAEANNRRKISYALRLAVSFRIKGQTSEIL